MKRIVLVWVSTVVALFPGQPVVAKPPFPHLTRGEVRYAVARYQQHFEPRDPYQLGRCRLGRRRAWCHVRNYPRGCGCSFDEPRWLEKTVWMEAYRTHLVVRSEFWETRLRLEPRVTLF